jgi:hypothetical protein
MKVCLILIAYILIIVQKLSVCDDKFPGFLEKGVQNFEVYYKYNQNTSTTDFNLVIPTNVANFASLTNGWIALGLNSMPSMDKTSAIVCRSTPTGVQIVHYYNNKTTPVIMDALNPTLGITNFRFVLNSTYIICSFTRQNTNSNARYFNLVKGNDPYFLVAYGLNGGNNFGINLTK